MKSKFETTGKIVLFVGDFECGKSTAGMFMEEHGFVKRNTHNFNLYNRPAFVMDPERIKEDFMTKRNRYVCDEYDDSKSLVAKVKASNGIVVHIARDCVLDTESREYHDYEIDYVIDNNGSLNNLKKNIKSFMLKIKDLESDIYKGAGFF